MLEGQRRDFHHSCASLGFMEVNSVDIGIREVKTMATNCKLNCLQSVQTESQGLDIGLQLCPLKSEYCCFLFFFF